MAFGTALYTYAATISRFRWASKAQAGTDYALQSSVWNLGVWAASSVSGFGAAVLGWTWFFPVAAGIAAIGGLFYIVLFNRIEKIVLDREAEEVSEHEQAEVAQAAD